MAINKKTNNNGPQKRLEGRRKEFYTRFSHGEALCDIVRVMSGKYHLTEQALYKDWHGRDTWGIILAEPEDDFVIQDYLQEMREVKMNLWQIALNSPDDKAKESSLAKIADINLRQLEANQTLGRVHKEPIKVDIQRHIDKLYSAIQEAAGFNKEVQEKLLDAFLIYERGQN